MDDLVYLCNGLLVLVFAFGAISKFRSQRGIEDTLLGIGLPTRWAVPTSRLLPVLELVIALALVPASSALAGAVASALLLTAFGLAIGAALWLGKKPICNCFGQHSQTPLSLNHLAVNVVLLLCSILMIVELRGGSGVGLIRYLVDSTRSMSLYGWLGIGAALLVVGNLWLSLELLRQNGRLFLAVDQLKLRLDAHGLDAEGSVDQRVHGLPPGTAAPDFMLPRLGGGTASLANLRVDGRPVLLLFSDPACGPCMKMLQQIERWDQQHAAALRIVVISRGSVQANEVKLNGLRISTVLLQTDREVAERYLALATPSAQLVAGNGLLQEVLALGEDEITALVARTIVQAQGDPIAANAAA